jgi:ATP-dependent DNA helicase RecG
MLNTVKAGYQTALMAPTEILAQQHYLTIYKLLKDAGYSIGLLTRSSKTIDGKNVSAKNMAQAIAEGKVSITVGTHALIQNKISFKQLGLVVIDEQHRFGVDQRKTLKLKSIGDNLVPHLLSMTATPIPRTLALTVYGDLDISTITELPAGRKKILTRIVPPEKRQQAYDFILKEIGKGRQAFVICPLIDESDKLGVKAATSEYQQLQKNIFPQLRIGLLHGKLKAEAKEHTMREFKDHRLSILVATAVMEVGIDVPNASVMMIEGAERFGLAQLHQFRGRVGRAAHQSYCFVFTDSDSEKTKDRLNALVTAKNGFELAGKDLEFRGPGEIYGLRQSGFPELRLAKLTDYEIIAQTRDASQQLFDQDSRLSAWPLLRDKLSRFSQNLHLE